MFFNYEIRTFRDESMRAIGVLVWATVKESDGHVERRLLRINSVEGTVEFVPMEPGAMPRASFYIEEREAGALADTLRAARIFAGEWGFDPPPASTKAMQAQIEDWRKVAFKTLNIKESS